ncbi:hypothetical protein U3516DRAFT_740255 [Neocallimastix sp. 'constans']
MTYKQFTKITKRNKAFKDLNLLHFNKCKIFGPFKRCIEFEKYEKFFDNNLTKINLALSELENFEKKKDLGNNKNLKNKLFDFLWELPDLKRDP